MYPTETSASSGGSMDDSSQSPPVTHKIHNTHKDLWLKVARDKKVLTKYEMDVKVIDRVDSVDALAEVFKDPYPLWEDFLIGKVLESAPHIVKVHVRVNKIWILSDKSPMIDVYEVNSRTMKFRITNPIVRSRILRRGMWNLAQVHVVMSKWTHW